MSDKPNKDGKYGKEVEYTSTRYQTKFSYSTLKNSYILICLVVTAIIFIMTVFQASKIRYLETKFTELETKVVELETKVVELETKSKNADLNAQLRNWNDNNNKLLGVVFGSDARFILAQNQILSPNAAWISLEKWKALTKEQQQNIPIAPDFVIELLYTDENLQIKQENMREYMNNGVQLGLLINRKSRQVEIYRQGKEVEVLESPQTVSGGNVLKGFVLDLERIW